MAPSTTSSNYRGRTNLTRAGIVDTRLICALRIPAFHALFSLEIFVFIHICFYFGLFLHLYLLTHFFYTRSRLWSDWALKIFLRLRAISPYTNVNKLRLQWVCLRENDWDGAFTPGERWVWDVDMARVYLCLYLFPFRFAF